MVICIGREFGSGGHEIGKLLAERLNIPLYDKVMVDVAVQSGLDRRLTEMADETKTPPLLYTAQYEGVDKRFRGLSASEMLFQIQSEFIVEKAKQGDCIFIGRCSDYVLEKEHIPRLSVFIAAPFGHRVERKMAQLDMDEKDAIALVRKTDKHRKAHYNYNTGCSWGKPHNYDICINSARGGIVGTVDGLFAYCCR